MTKICYVEVIKWLLLEINFVVDYIIIEMECVIKWLIVEINDVIGHKIWEIIVREWIEVFVS